MLSRTITAPTLLVASVGLPYVASNAPEWSQQIRGAATVATAPASEVQASAPLAAQQGVAPVASFPAANTAPSPLPVVSSAPPLHGPGAAALVNRPPVEGIQAHSLSDVLRMDVSKEWVYQQWPRKSTALAELDLYGVRVPLVSGTQLYDIAGSLTYFFGPDGRVQRISFRGRTGDTTQLAGLVHQRFGLTAQPTVIAGEQLLQYRRGDEVLSELRTQPAPVLWANSPHESFTVELELQHPATAKPLAPRVSLPAANPAPGAGGQNSAKPQAAGDAKTQAGGGAKETAAAAKGTEATAEEPLGWKTFFPRSRATTQQIRNLNQGNLYP